MYICIVVVVLFPQKLLPRTIRLKIVHFSLSFFDQKMCVFFFYFPDKRYSQCVFEGDKSFQTISILYFPPITKKNILGVITNSLSEIEGAARCRCGLNEMYQSHWHPFFWLLRGEKQLSKSVNDHQ